MTQWEKTHMRGYPQEGVLGQTKKQGQLPYISRTFSLRVITCSGGRKEKAGQEGRGGLKVAPNPQPSGRTMISWCLVFPYACVYPPPVPPPPPRSSLPTPPPPHCRWLPPEPLVPTSLQGSYHRTTSNPPPEKLPRAEGKRWGVEPLPNAGTPFVTEGVATSQGV